MGHASETPTQRFSFPKSRRLLHRRDFLRVQQQGKKHNLGPLLVCVLAQESDGPSRVGITTSRKVGKAHFRNRLRRLIREAARRFLLPEALAFDIVFIAKKNLPLTLEQDVVDRAVIRLVQRLRS